MPLVRGPNGGLLRGPGGGLAASTSCCCDDDCQTCCIKITSGALIDGVIKVFATSGSNTLEIDITTQSGTRLVCDGESVTLAIKYRNSSDAAYLINSMVVSFDPAWKYGSNSPAEDSKHEYPGGFVYWENTTAEEYTVTLNLRNCFFYPYPSLGAITVNGDDFEEVIAIQVCSVSTPCCTQPWECLPCCWAMQKLTVGASDFVNYAPPFDWHWNSTLLRWEHLEYSNGFWFLAWIKPPDPEHITLYCKDELFDIGLEIGSEDPLLVNQIKSIAPADPGPIKVEFVTGDFYEDMTTEIPAGATLVLGPDTITWEEEKAFSYKASIKHTCADPGQEQIVFKAWIDLDGDTLQSVTDPSVEATLLLERCEDTEEPCCCTCCDVDTLKITYEVRDDARATGVLFTGEHSWIIPDLECGTQTDIDAPDLYQATTYNGDLYEHRLIVEWVKCPDPVLLTDVTVFLRFSLHRNGAAEYNLTLQLSRSCNELPMSPSPFGVLQYSDYTWQLLQ